LNPTRAGTAVVVGSVLGGVGMHAEAAAQETAGKTFRYRAALIMRGRCSAYKRRATASVRRLL